MDVTENKIKTIEIKIEKLEKEVCRIKKDVSVMDKEVLGIKIELQKDTKQIFDLLKNLERNMKEFKEEINDIKLKPAKRWDSIIMVIITIIVTSAVNYFMVNGGF